MSVTVASVADLAAEYPGLEVVAQRAGRTRRLLDRLLGRPAGHFGPVALAVRVVVGGIRGGGSRTRVDYELLLDLTELEHRLPTAWVLAPTNADIRHVNIFGPTHGDARCPLLDTDLPNVCWFRFAEAWSAAPPWQRTLGAALEFLKQLLNTENHDSPAR